jgi:integration host factor subunit alpha
MVSPDSRAPACPPSGRNSTYRPVQISGAASRELIDCLERGETVKLSSFGSFVVRKNGQRMGRNPKTGEEAPISPRRVVVFKPSSILKQRINTGTNGRKEPGE